MYQAVIVGGFIAALSDTIPYLSFINCLCCMGIAAGGVMAVFKYKNLEPGKEFVLPELIQIGLLTGMAGAIIAFVIHFIVFNLIGNWQMEFLTNWIESLDEIPADLEILYEELKRPELQGFAGMAILIRSLILFPVFTLAGALFANKILERIEQK